MRKTSGLVFLAAVAAWSCKGKGAAGSGLESSANAQEATAFSAITADDITQMPTQVMAVATSIAVANNKSLTLLPGSSDGVSEVCIQKTATSTFYRFALSGNLQNCEAKVNAGMTIEWMPFHHIITSITLAMF